MKIRTTYPNLANFLGAWFPDADLEGMTDIEATSAFLRSESLQVKNAVRQELAGILKTRVPLPFDEIAQEANRYFKSEAACRDWLTMLNDVLTR